MKKSFIKNLMFFLVVMILTIVLELAFDSMSIRNENIYLFFMLSIFVIIIETKNLYYGIIGSICLVFSYNYFITVPKYSFRMDNPNYYVSFIIFIVVALILNSLVIQLQKQIEISKISNKRVETMYEYSSMLLNTKNYEEIIENTIVLLNKYFNRNISIILDDGKQYGATKNINLDSNVIKECLLSNRITNVSKPNSNNLIYSLFPISSTICSYGVLAIDVKESTLSSDDEILITNIIDEMIVALDKDYISNEQQKSKLEVEKEKFKTSLLRGLSHDIKTPLTMIQSGSNFLVDSFNQIDDESKLGIIKDIYSQSNDLSRFVNNLLDMTRLSSGSAILNRKYEPVDEILAEVKEKVVKRLDNISLNIEQSKDCLMVYVDASLLIQIFLNLIENVVVHAKTATLINILYYEKDDQIIFKVEDNGEGIKEEILDKIFEDYYSLTSKQDKQRSYGLGLSICKSIIENHGGYIKAYNSVNGGAIFEFGVPSKEIKDE